MPVENYIVLAIVTGAMIVFLSVTTWLSLDRNKLPRDDHGAAEYAVRPCRIQAT